MRNIKIVNQDKILFYLIFGWCVVPMMWRGKKIGDIFHYNETPKERKARHEIEEID